MRNTDIAEEKRLCRLTKGLVREGEGHQCLAPLFTCGIGGGGGHRLFDEFKDEFGREGGEGLRASKVGQRGSNEGLGSGQDVLPFCL